MVEDCDFDVGVVFEVVVVVFEVSLLVAFISVVIVEVVVEASVGGSSEQVIALGMLDGQSFFP